MNNTFWANSNCTLKRERKMNTNLTRQASFTHINDTEVPGSFSIQNS